MANQLRGRNRAVFLTQLEFGVWLLYAKLSARQWQLQLRLAARGSKRLLSGDQPVQKHSRAQDPDGKRAAPIRAIIEYVRGENPLMPRRRCLDGWAEATSAALGEMGLLTLEKRRSSQKQPKAQSVGELRAITFAHLRRIVARYETMAKLREALLPDCARGEGQKTGGEVTLCRRVLELLDREVPLSQRLLPWVRQLARAASESIALTRKVQADRRPERGGPGKILPTKDPRNSNNGS